MKYIFLFLLFISLFCCKQKIADNYLALYGKPCMERHLEQLPLKKFDDLLFLRYDSITSPRDTEFIFYGRKMKATHSTFYLAYWGPCGYRHGSPSEFSCDSVAVKMHIVEHPSSEIVKMIKAEMEYYYHYQEKKYTSEKRRDTVPNFFVVYPLEKSKIIYFGGYVILSQLRYYVLYHEGLDRLYCFNPIKEYVAISSYFDFYESDAADEEERQQKENEKLFYTKKNGDTVLLPIYSQRYRYKTKNGIAIAEGNDTIFFSIENKKLLREDGIKELKAKNEY